MKKHTKLSISWFYELLEKGECEIMDFKEHLENREYFGKSLKNYAKSYDELARDAVAFANKKGGFLFIGIEDATKLINKNFNYDDSKLFELIKQVQDRTRPSITLIPHKLIVDGHNLLVLEIPFTMDLYSTTKGEYLIRSNNGNRAIQPNEMATLLSEKGSIIYDQQTWNFQNWQDQSRVEALSRLIRIARPDSPLLKDNIDEFNDVLSLAKDFNEETLPTLTGILFTGTDKVLKNFPYASIKYIRYFEDGTYRPYEWSGNLIEVADGCFTQLKAEIQQQEMNFGLFHETIEDYSEIVLRELLINALAHRDYSRYQIIEIRKYPNYIEFESPGLFPQGINSSNFLWKTNARNPEIMDIFRHIKYAEKAGSGWDKIFVDLLSKGKSLPSAQETDTSVVFRIESAVITNKLIEVTRSFQQISGKTPSVEELLILNTLIEKRSCSRINLEKIRYIDSRQIQLALKELIDLNIVETSGYGSGTEYLLHKNYRTSIQDRVRYSQAKKQEKAQQREAILRYLDDFETISNKEARILLRLRDKDIYSVSRLFSDLVRRNEIERITSSSSSQTRYRRRKK